MRRVHGARSTATPVNSCLVPVAQVEGTRVTTIEGLGGTHPLQRAFVEHGGAQCGICTPGMILAAVALGPRPSSMRFSIGLAGNLCRCTGYSAIYRSRSIARGKTLIARHESLPVAICSSRVRSRDALKMLARRRTARRRWPGAPTCTSR